MREEESSPWDVMNIRRLRSTRSPPDSDDRCEFRAVEKARWRTHRYMGILYDKIFYPPHPFRIPPGRSGGASAFPVSTQPGDFGQGSPHPEGRNKRISSQSSGAPPLRPGIGTQVQKTHFRLPDTWVSSPSARIFFRLLDFRAGCSRHRERLRPFFFNGNAGKYHSLIMTSIILIFFTAETAWGALAGKMMVSPSFIMCDCPDTTTSQSPSRIVTTAS